MQSIDPRAPALLRAANIAPDDENWRNIIYTIQIPAHPDMVALLLPLLTSTQRDVPRMAADRLGYLRDPRVAAALVQLLRKSVDEIDLTSWGGIIQPRQLEFRVNLPFSSNGNSLISALSQQGASAVPALLELLRDEQPNLRVCAALVMAQIRDARAREPLEALLKSTDPLARASAASALGYIEDIRALPALTSAFTR